MTTLPVYCDDVKILCVEDDEASRRIMELIFTRSLKLNGVTILSNSVNFPAVLNSFPSIANLVFLDIHVKPYDGYQMLEFIRHNAAWQHTTVVAVTASVLAHEVEDLKSAGFNGLIGKPINAACFPDYFNQLLNGEEVWNPSWD